MIQEQVKYTDIREGLLSRAGDTVYAFRFVRLLVQKWEKTEEKKNKQRCALPRRLF